jgi:nitroreductase
MLPPFDVRLLCIKVGFISIIYKLIMVFLLDVFEAIKRRRSIRKYERTKIEKEKLLNVLEAARLAPSAMNRQPYIFVVTSDTETIKKISSGCNQQWDSPIIIAICSFPDKAWVRDDGEEYWKVDAAVAMTNLSLQACAEGLGTCWIAAFKEDEIKQILGIKKGRVVAMTPLGYPAEKKGPVTNRKSIDELVQFQNL